MEQPPRFVHSNKFIHKIERTVVLKSPILRKNYQQKTGIASHWEKKEEKRIYRSDETRNEIDNRGVTLAAWWTARHWKKRGERKKKEIYGE